jgi:hypothetical protein
MGEKNILSRGVDTNLSVSNFQEKHNTTNFIMKTLKELVGAKLLGKKEQKAILGGKRQCTYDKNGYLTCPLPYTCVEGTCELRLED